MNTIETVAARLAARSRLQVYLLGFALAGSILFNVIYFCLGLILPHYNAFQHSISNLQQHNGGWVQSVNFIIFGLSICSFGIAIRNELKAGFGFVLLPLLYWITGLSLILAGLNIYNPVHNTMLVVAFAGVCFSFILFSIRLSGDRRWKGWTAYTTITVILMSVLITLFVYFSNTDGSYAGVYERLAVTARLVWMITFIIKLFDGRKL